MKNFQPCQSALGYSNKNLLCGGVALITYFFLKHNEGHLYYPGAGRDKDILKAHSVTPPNSSISSAGQIGSTHLTPHHSTGRGRRIASLRAAWNAEQDCVQIKKQTNK